MGVEIALARLNTRHGRLNAGGGFMVADETALVLAMPDEDVAALLGRLLSTQARRVQLLVPEGVELLRDPEAVAELGRATDRQGVELILISGDDATLRAARASGLLTMQVHGARVLPPAQNPPAPPPAASPYATRVLEPEPRDVATGNLARDLSAGDAAFLEALDDLDAAPLRHSPYTEDDRLSDELISLYNADQRYSQSTEGRDLADQLRARSAASLDEDIAAALDSIDEEARPATRTPPLPSPRRVRPEDIELTEEDQRRLRGTPRPAPRSTRPTPRRDRPAAPVFEPPVEERSGMPRWLMGALVAGLLLLLGAIALVLLLTRGAAALPELPIINSATISISLPPVADELEPVRALAVPLAEPGTLQTPAGQVATAIEASALMSDVAINVEGEVAEATLAPSGTAAGTVTVLNRNSQAIPLPAGTEFVAIRPDGQEVPFISTVEVLVPPATTADQGAQIVTTLGQVDVPVSARSAGSASNVDANTIVRMTLPDGTSFAVLDGSLRVRHDALIGGSETEARVVKDSDVQRALAAALASLDAEARRQLEGLASARGLALDENTIEPRQADLEQLQGFEYRVDPPLGSNVDPANPRFALSVQARYSALATPSTRSLADQLEVVFTEQLRLAGRLQPGDCRAPKVTGWDWDGSTLFVDGEIGPDPRCGAGIDPAVEQQVKDAVRGKPRAEAETALQALVDAGVIASYSLPADLETLPDEDRQIRVELQ